MSTFSERPDSEQAQRLLFANVHLPLGLVEAATLLGYWTMRDAEDRDVPAAAAFRMKRQKEFYLGAILMELALHGRLHMDRTTPLENHAYWYEQRQKRGSWKVLWFFVPPLALSLACLIAFQHAQQQLALLFLLGSVAYILLRLLLAVVRALLSRGESVQGKLGVVDPTPMGNHVLDAILWQMLSAGQSRQAYQWLYSPGALRADGLYAFTERRLAEHGWITLTGKQPVLGGLFKAETLVINRQSEQWQVLSNQLRSALVLGDSSSPEMVALLLLLTVFTHTFHTPRQLRFPGQPHRKIVSGLYQVLSSPEEITIARQRLQALMRGDQGIAAAIGVPLYDMLLSIRDAIESSIESKRASTV
jgi:hypothetical protein